MNVLKRLHEFRNAKYVVHKTTGETFKYLGPIQHAASKRITVAYEMEDAHTYCHGIRLTGVYQFHRDVDDFLTEFEKESETV